MLDLNSLLAGVPVVPVLTFKDTDEAVRVCTCLYGEGLTVLEITLRRDSALACISAVAKALPDDAIIGAGTVLDKAQAVAARDAGAVFGVSPGLTRQLSADMRAMAWPFLPGIATLGEAMTAREEGFHTLKFFPAELSGGIKFLKAIGSVLPDLKFCPTGGVTGATAANYLALPNVATVGGSWLTERSASGEIDLDIVRTKASAVRATL